jgi:hypothetical protein
MKAYDTSESEITQEHASDEKLLWSGRPSQRLILNGMDLYLMAFGLVWMIGAVAGIVSFIQKGQVEEGAWLGAFMAFVFAAIGFYVFFGRILVERYRRRKTWYGVTSERVIVISNCFGKRTVHSQLLRLVDEIRLSLKSGDHGTIDFGAGQTSWSASGWPGYFMKGSMMLILASEARTVHSLIHEAQRSLFAPSTIYPGRFMSAAPQNTPP